MMLLPRTSKVMPSKKKDKEKSFEWLQCSLCGKLVSRDDAEAHSASCDAEHGFIKDQMLHAKILCADDQLKDDVLAITKSIRDRDNAVWLATSTMQMSGLSIGQPCIVNGIAIKRSWPLKGVALSSVAMTSQCLNELGLAKGQFLSVKRFVPQERIVQHAEIQLSEHNETFTSEEFCAFVASYLDGKYIRRGTPLFIRYFGQVCRATVLSVTCTPDPNTDPLNTHTLNYGQYEDSPQTPLSAKSSRENMLHSTPVTESQYLSSSFASLNISNTGDGDVSLPNSAHPASSPNISVLSASSPSSTPTRPTRQDFPNLHTPLKATAQAGGLAELFPEVQDFAKVSSKITKVSIRSSGDVVDASENDKDGIISMEDIGGVSAHIDELKSRIMRAQQNTTTSRCILLHGPAGTGKSMMVKALTASLGVNVTHIAGTDIWSKLFGEAESNLNKIFKSAKERAPSIIVIDDIDVICPKRSQNSAGQQEHRIVGTLLTLIDEISVTHSAQPKVVVIGITNNRDGLDPALRRSGRFGLEVEVGVPTASQRIEILKVLLRKVSITLKEEDIETVAKNAHGYVGADLTALVNEAMLLSLNREDIDMTHPEAFQTPSISLNDLTAAGLKIKPSALREIQLEVPKVRWTDIGGMHEVKTRLKEAVELPLSHPEVFARLAIDPPRGLLMYGPPGCSKTMIARALATECQLNFLAVKGPELFNQYVGESEKAIREVFRKARSAAPSVIFFDEIDAIAATRGSSSGGSGVDDRVLTQLLTEMDGLEFLKDVFIMAATNRPDKIDRALLRPGRFDSLVYVPLPDADTRREILEKKLSRMKTAQDVSAVELVGRTQGYSGAEIVQVCQEAAYCALRENMDAERIENRHFETAFDKIQPQIDETLLAVYEKFSNTRIK